MKLKMKRPLNERNDIEDTHLYVKSTSTYMELKS